MSETTDSMRHNLADELRLEPGVLKPLSRDKIQHLHTLLDIVLEAESRVSEARTDIIEAIDELVEGSPPNDSYIDSFAHWLGDPKAAKEILSGIVSVVTDDELCLDLGVRRH